MRKGILLIPDNDEEEQKIIQFWTGYKTNNTSQSTLTNNKQNTESEGRKYFCNNPDCKKEIDKSVVAFCLHTDNKDRFKGKVYCRECQEGK